MVVVVARTPGVMPEISDLGHTVVVGEMIFVVRCTSGKFVNVGVHNERNL